MRIFLPPGPFTVFAPTNAAFDALPADVKSALAKDMNLLKQVLEFHVIDGKTYSSELSNDLKVSTEAEGLDVRVNIYGKVHVYHDKMSVKCIPLVPHFL